MPYFISPLSSQLTVSHKLSWFFFFSLLFVSLSLICPFAACCHTVSLPPSPHFLLCVCYLSFALSPPRFCHFRQGNVKKKEKKIAQLLRFILCSFNQEGQFCSLLPTTFRVLLFKVNEDHISSAWSYMAGRGGAGLLWENKYYGRSNFVILIWPGSMCVLLDRIHYTNT